LTGDRIRDDGRDKLIASLVFLYREPRDFAPRRFIHPVDRRTVNGSIPVLSGLWLHIDQCASELVVGCASIRNLEPDNNAKVPTGSSVRVSRRIIPKNASAITRGVVHAPHERPALRDPVDGTIATDTVRER
jgi:hypothetical protein